MPDNPSVPSADPPPKGLPAWLFRLCLRIENSLWRSAGSAHLKHSEPEADTVSPLALFRSIALMCIATNTVLIGFALAGPDLVAAETRNFAITGCVLFTFLELASITLVLKGKRNIAGWLMMCATWLAVVTVILLTGGIFRSVALPLLMIIPCICYCLGTVRAGLLAATSAPLFICAAQAGFAWAGLTLPDYTSRANASFNMLMLTGSTYMMVVLCIGGLVRSNALLHRRLRAEHEKLEELASLDSLTGIANRRSFDEALANQLALGHAETGKVGVILMDLNGFKPINDRYGHPVGDQVLKIIAKRLAQSAGLALVARQGGDEFAMITKNGLDRKGLEMLAYDIKQMVSEPMDIGGIGVSVSGSFGFVLFPEDGSTVDALIRAADAGLYHDKRGKLVTGPWTKRIEPLPNALTPFAAKRRA